MAKKVYRIDGGEKHSRKNFVDQNEYEGVV